MEESRPQDGRGGVGETDIVWVVPLNRFGPPLLCLDGVDWELVALARTDLVNTRYTVGIKRMIGGEMWGAWHLVPDTSPKTAVAMARLLAGKTEKLYLWADPSQADIDGGN